MTLADLYRTDKAIAYFPGWSEPEIETGYCWFLAPLEIGGVVQNDFVLKGGCYKRHPDRNVSFELRTGAPGIKRKIPLARADWRSNSGGHSNKRGPNLPYAGKRVSEDHIHRFEINWIEHESRMRNGNLPQAEPFDEDIQSFEALRDHIGKLFRISNISLVTRPDWEYSLFHYGE